MQFDIIIIGGGMVGASLACALQTKNVSIALVDSALQSAEDERLIALNDNSVGFFEKMGIWKVLVEHAAPIKQIHVSHRGRFGITRINAKDMQLAALGYVVPAKYINAALNNALSHAPHIQVLRPAILKTLDQEENSVTLSISTSAGMRELKASRVIGADGTHSTVRQLLDIPTEKIDYQQSALVTVTELQRDHQHIAYERFLKSGAIAMLPLADKKVATIWTDSTESINELMKLDDAGFLSQLQKQFGYRLGRLNKVGKRAQYPLQMILAKEHRKQNVILIGNALHTMHPVAAQGLNLALYEVAGLAENWVWDEFKPQTFNIQLAHRLIGLFSSDAFLLNKVRQLGMIGLDVFPVVKKRFAQQAMGKTGKLPNLLLRDNG